MIRLTKGYAFLIILLFIGKASSYTTPLAGPYLQTMTSESVSIMWETKNPCLGTVHYGKGELLLTAQEVKPATMHRIRLTDLDPSTLYGYRCRWEEHITETYTFQTAPRHPTRPLRIALLGNTYKNPETTHKIAEAMRAQQADLILHTGNLIERANEPSHWHNQFFQPMQTILRSVPLYSVFGEHEHDSWRYFHYMDLPGNERYWSEDYGSIHLVSLDSSQAGDPNSKQYKWLEKDLKNRTKPWTFVLIHQPLFSVYPEEGIHELRWSWQPLFQNYNVSLVISGHDQYYLRTYPIGPVHESIQQGVPHLTTGGGGAPIYPHEKSFTAYSASQPHWVMLEVQETHIRGTMYNLEGRRLDTFVIDPQNHMSPEEFVSYEMLMMERDLRHWSQSYNAVRADKEIVELHGKVEVNNSFQIPILGEIEWHDGDQWTIVPKKETITLATGSPLNFEFTAYTQSDKTYPLPSLHLRFSDHQPQNNDYVNPTGFRNNQVVLHPLKVYKKVSVEVVRAATEITIDGKAQDVEWKNAQPITSFYTDEHGMLPPRNTKAQILHDDQNIYLHIFASQNRAAYDPPRFQGKDNPHLEGNEHAGVRIVHGENAWTFIVTPQGDTLDRLGSNVGWNAEWNAAVQHVDQGWNAEIKIPKKIFAGANGNLRINLFRHDAQNNQDYVLCPSFHHEENQEVHTAELRLN